MPFAPTWPELGIVAPVGVPQVKKLLRIIADTDDARLPSLARTCLESLARQFLSLHDEIHAAEKRIHAWHRMSEVSRRLETIPGVGPIIASALAASITDPRGVQEWPRTGHLDRACAATELNRRQTAARQNLQTGRSISALVAGCRSHVGDHACETAGYDKPAMACRHHRPQASQGPPPWRWPIRPLVLSGSCSGMGEHIKSP